MAEHDVIVVGSGAGGASATCRLVKDGRRVLMLEKGGFLPRDGSTLDVKAVFKSGRFKNQEPWGDGESKPFVPGEFYNLGGKTKWYGAALLRFAAHEFAADPAHVNRFDNEPELQSLIDQIVAHDPSWRPEALPPGLKKEILEDPAKAKHFDGFASACG